MVKQYREIRGRYADSVGGVADHQMLRDIQALLRYVDHLHETLVRQAEEHLVNHALDAFDGQEERRAATH